MEQLRSHFIKDQWIKEDIWACIVSMIAERVVYHYKLILKDGRERKDQLLSHTDTVIYEEWDKEIQRWMWIRIIISALPYWTDLIMR